MIAGYTRSAVVSFLAVCAVLTGAVALEWLPGSEPDQPVVLAHKPHAATAAAKADESRDTDEWSDTILERPLFNISRRPVKVDAAKGQTGAGMPRLAAILISHAGTRAIFMPDNSKPLVLAVGATMADGVIRSIFSDRVVVAGPKGDEVLTPTLEKQRTNTGPASGTSPFVPGGPGFNGGPPFNGTPGMPQPGGFQTGFTPPSPPDNATADDQDATPPPPMQLRPMRPSMPGFRGPAIPRGRE
jgi:hypothetical protein